MPVALKEGIDDHINIEDFDRTMKELVFQYFCDTSTGQTTDKKRMNEFLTKIKATDQTVASIISLLLLLLRLTSPFFCPTERTVGIGIFNWFAIA